MCVLCCDLLLRTLSFSFIPLQSAARRGVTKHNRCDNVVRPFSCASVSILIHPPSQRFVICIPSFRTAHKREHTTRAHRIFVYIRGNRSHKPTCISHERRARASPAFSAPAACSILCVRVCVRLLCWCTTLLLRQPACSVDHLPWLLLFFERPPRNGSEEGEGQFRAYVRQEFNGSGARHTQQQGQ